MPDLYVKNNNVFQKVPQTYRDRGKYYRWMPRKYRYVINIDSGEPSDIAGYDGCSFGLYIQRYNAGFFVQTASVHGQYNDCRMEDMILHTDEFKFDLRSTFYEPGERFPNLAPRYSAVITFEVLTNFVEPDGFTFKCIWNSNHFRNGTCSVQSSEIIEGD